MPLPVSHPRLGEVDDVLDDLLGREGAVLAALGPETAGLVATATDLAGGGKRVRAAFCLWGADALPGRTGARTAGVVEAAAALEMFHLAALVHDDVMDRSDLRRGVATAHRRFGSQHRARGLLGSADLYGDAVATLLGDLCFSWADDLLHRALARLPETGTKDPTSADGPPTRERVRRVWEQMRTETMAGQYLDLLAQASPDVTESTVGRVLQHKSAGYTVVHPLVLGGTIAGASPALLAGYVDLGRRVGEAFQLRDDVLGLYGDARATGKPVTDDVREGKRTLLVVWAEEGADRDQRATLRAHLGDAEVDAAGVEAVRRVVTDTGALARVEARIDTLVAGAAEVLDALPVQRPAREALSGLVDASAWRAA